MKFDTAVIIVSFLLLGAGILFSFWPIVPLGIALLVLYGHTALGVVAGLFFDLLYGTPVGLLAPVFFPFLLFALVCIGLRVLALRFLLERTDLTAV